MRLRAACALSTGHLNRCPVQVEGAALTGTFLFESATSSLGDASCQFEVQVVDVRDGLTDLFVEHRGAGPSLQMCRGGVLGKLRQLGVTKVHIPKKREPVPCFALYTLDPALTEYRMTGTKVQASGSATESVGKLEDSHMHFTLIGECVDSPQTTREKHDARLPSILADACKGKGVSPSRQEVRQSPWEWDGATMVDRDGFPSCHEDMEHLLVHDYEVRDDTCCTVAGADFLQGTGR